MGDGSRTIIPISNRIPLVSDNLQTPERKTEDDEHGRRDPKDNGATVFNRNWNNSQASNRRDVLMFLLTGDAQQIPHSTTEQTVTHQTRQVQNLVNQTWESLVNTAREHADFTRFDNQPKDFWDNVRQMSDVKIVDTYVKGKLEPQVVSRYGTLLESFNRQGGQLNSFISSLPMAERDVFLARYQLNQTFGATELFVGNGIALDKNGQFPLREFLSNNGKNVDLPIQTFLGLIGGGVRLNELSTSLFINGQMLLNDKTAALLSLSLSLYQNINSSLSATLLNILNESKTASASLETALINNAKERPVTNSLLVAALINGTLTTIENYRELKNKTFNTWIGNDAEPRKLRFSAGATGAMMGAVIGCISPMAESRSSEVIGFAASVVVGLADGGMRKLGANLLVYRVLEGASAIKQINSARTAARSLLNEAKDIYEKELKQTILNGRINAYLAS